MSHRGTIGLLAAAVVLMLPAFGCSGQPQTPEPTEFAEQVPPPPFQVAPAPPPPAATAPRSTGSTAAIPE